MPIADERGLAPFIERDAAAGLQASGFGEIAPDAGRRGTLHRARYFLDGVGGLGWSVIGFVIGAVFWHFIGFWAFVSDVVLAGGPIGAVERSVVYAVPQLQSRPRWVEMADASSSSCTTLLLDRDTGLTSARPCDGDAAMLLARDTFQGREDRIISPRLAPRAQDTLHASDRAVP